MIFRGAGDDAGLHRRLMLLVRMILVFVALIGGHEASAAMLNCGALQEIRITDTRIDHAAMAPAGPFTLPPSPMAPPRAPPSLPAFCRVTATIRPETGSEIRFEVWLPTAGWNGRFMQVGNSGLAGTIAYAALADRLTEGYAVASTDDGHRAAGAEGVWAYGHPERLIDYGSRAVHLTAGAAQAIARSYYGKGARFRYFVGCSDGGRESLMEAQRYPGDFDGYLAGAPGIDIPDGSLALLHAARVLQALPPADRVTPDTIRLLSAHVLAQCDALDGVKDGVLRDPRACAFDPATIVCATHGATSCLTPAQATAIAAIYKGPTDPTSGRLLAPGLRPTLGAESVVWTGLLVTRDGSPPPVGGVAASYLAGVLYGQDKPDPMQLDLSQVARDAAAFYRPAISPADPDLSTARALGRKIIQYQGWSDPLNPPHLSTDYQRAAQAATKGGLDDVYRLFMVPGMAHCGGGVGPITIGHTGDLGADASTIRDPRHDWLRALEAWVERGTPPTRMIATEFATDRTVRSTRPLCVYPQVAAYRGGDMRDAASFECRMP